MDSAWLSLDPWVGGEPAERCPDHPAPLGSSFPKEMCTPHSPGCTGARHDDADWSDSESSRDMCSASVGLSDGWVEFDDDADVTSLGGPLGGAAQERDLPSAVPSMLADIADGGSVAAYVARPRPVDCLRRYGA